MYADSYGVRAQPFLDKTDYHLWRMPQRGMLQGRSPRSSTSGATPLLDQNIREERYSCIQILLPNLLPNTV